MKTAITGGSVRRGALAALLLAALGAVSGQAVAQSPAGLVAHYCFERDLTSDCAEAHNPGIVVGDVTRRTGRVGMGARFGGFNSLGYIRVPNSPSLTITRAMTVAFWVKQESLAGQSGNGGPSARTTQVPLAKSFDRVGLFTGLEGSSTNNGAPAVGFTVIGNGTASAPAPDTFFIGLLLADQINVWVHLAVTLNPANRRLEIYVNGRLRAVKTSDQLDLTETSREDLFLGAQAPLFGENQFQYPLHGMLDEVKVFNRALRAEEISAVFGADGCDAVVPPPRSVSFEGAAASAIEGARGRAVLRLSEPATSTITVPYTISGTADASDFTTARLSPIRFTAGSSEVVVPLNVENDGLAEAAETVVLTLGTPTGGAVVGPVREFVLRIPANDGGS